MYSTKELCEVQNLLKQTFDFDDLGWVLGMSPWGCAGINPMKMRDIRRACGVGTKGYVRLWRGALQNLTGQPDPVATTLIVGGRPINGRLWFMPPLRCTEAVPNG